MPRLYHSGQLMSSPFSEKLGSMELRAGFSLGLIYVFRMSGLFMILPVFALYAEGLPGATPQLTGLAIGIYGLTQALFQIPFGMLSDKIGRKPVITGALIIFAMGSLLAASADDIMGIIAGRALQGSGAIAAALMALAADLSREEHRTRMMAMIGASVGLAFAVSMVFAPVVNKWIGVPGIFAGTAVLALLGIAVLYLLVPDPVHSHFHRDAEIEVSSLAQVLKTPDLLRLDVGIFALHFVLMSLFLVVPIELRDSAGLVLSDHWQVYLPVFIVSIILMIPLIIISERKQAMKPVFIGAIVLLMLSTLTFFVSTGLLTLVLALVLFYTAFNLMEAMLPSLISKTASASSKGTAMGVYSTSQFLGTFAGGTMGGYAHGAWGIHGVYVAVLVMLFIWFCIAALMKKPSHYNTYLLKVGKVDNASVAELTRKLTAIAGVIEAAVIGEEGVAYLKVEKRILDEEKLLSFAVTK